MKILPYNSAGEFIGFTIGTAMSLVVINWIAPPGAKVMMGLVAPAVAK